LGNCISCNDHIALVHKEFDKETVEIIEDVLGVETIRASIGGNSLVGSYMSLSNQGCLVHPKVSTKEQDNLSQILQVPVVSGTVNRGSNSIGSGMVVNDWKAFCGLKTTSTEISIVESIFNLKDSKPEKIIKEFRESIIDSL
jgi:translation initiation factor 6